MKLSYSMTHQCQIQYTAGQQGVHGGYVVVQYPGQTLFPQPLQPFPAPHTIANCPAVFLLYFSLWICYEIQPAVVTPYTAVQNVWTISPARNHQFESSFWLKRLAIYM